MKISKLEISNFRGVQSLKLEKLHEKLNVFVGVNGAGKSTVLDASAILLSWMVSSIKHAGTSGRPIQESDIRNRESTASLDITCKYKGNYFGWNLAKTRKGRSKKEVASVLIAVTEVAKQIQGAITASDEQINLPLFTYYPVNRAVLDIPLRIKEKHRFDLLEAYDEALSGGASFRHFFEWFRQREDLENENRKYADQLIKP
ncbi:MAG: ATP-binding protein, partial [Candidatus Thiodiazotropha sp. (ex Lucinoma kastoroae)]|nr:ATP-binding protein [Candidatus Thiodiazotropha sp. (ex Lucinoma kastoroae)]